jgi:hypothetical protein
LKVINDVSRDIRRTRPPIWCAELACLVIGLAAGCGNSQGRLPLEGTVNFKGQPLTQGIIQFDSAESQTAAFATGAPIKDGAYSVPGKSGLPPGKYTVRISAQSKPYFPPGHVKGNPPATRELIPLAYNEESREVIEMKSAGANKFDFNIP